MNNKLKAIREKIKTKFCETDKKTKIRLSSVISIGMAMVMIPAIAVSANTGMDYSLKAAPNLTAKSQINNGNIIAKMPVAAPVENEDTNIPAEPAVNETQQAPNTEANAEVNTQPEAPEVNTQPSAAEANTQQTAPEVNAQPSAPEASAEPEFKEWTENSEGEEVIEEGLTVDEIIPPESKYLSLEPESTHPDVIELQKRLMELNYMDNDEPTEYYGPMTQRAVSYFQRKHELDIDGVAGVQTQELLFSDDAKTYSVTVGAEGLDVSSIQERLNELGYDVGVTGYFGTDTEEGVKYFQRMNGLDDDGSVGSDTKDVLFSQNAEPAEQKKQQSSQGGGKSSKGGGSKSGGSSSGGGGGSTSYSANPGSVSSFLDAAYAQVGKPYVTGGKGPDSFDCSGFVYYALQQSGNGIGYMTSGGWAGSGYPTVGSISELQPGDIICFSGHVGIYAGGGTMIDASSSKGQVVVRDCTGSWSQNNFICGKRPL